MSQQDVLATVEADLKLSAKALLVSIAATGGPLDAELSLVAADLGTVAVSILPAVKPMLLQAVQSLIAKL